MKSITSLAIFCGSHSGNLSTYTQNAETMGKAFVDASVTLVYGGAKVGLMGAISEKVLQDSGKVIGVIPKSLVDVELAHEGLTELHVVDSMHERKALIAQLSDGFIMMPGGSGSLDEFFEMYTWGQLGYHEKPCCILNVDGYYDHLLAFLDHATEQGFMRESHRAMILVDSCPEKLMKKIFAYTPPADKKWIKTTES